MNRLNAAISTLLLITLASAAVTGQKRATKRSETQSIGPSETTEKKALALVDQISSASAKFSDDLLRLKTQTKIADLLWYHDRARARRLFEDVFRAIESLEPKVGQGYSSTAPDLVDGLKFEMRKELLQAVSKRDADFAEKLIASIPPARIPDPAMRQLAFDREIVEHNLMVAIDVVASDPERAARLGRDSLGRIVSASFTKMIRLMRATNPELADRLFIDALAAVKRRPAYISNKIGILAPYVFAELKQEPDDHMAQLSNPEIVAQFLDFVYDALMQQSPTVQVGENSPFGTSSFDQLILQRILPYLEKLNPKRGSELRARIDEIVKAIEDTGRKDLFDTESEAWAELFRANVQELIKKAEESKSLEERDSLYANAAFLLAQRDKEFEKAVLLIEKIGDQHQRAYLLTMLRPGAVYLALKHGETERAYKLAGDVTKLEEQIRIFLDIARKMIEKGEKRRAEVVVDETAGLIQHLTSADGKAEKLLELAAIAVQLDSVRGFAITRSAVDATNSAEFGPHWSAQDTYKRTATPDPPRAVASVAGLEYLRFDESFSALARGNFDKALALARTIRMNEASMLAQLAVCRGVLVPSTPTR